MVSEKVAWTVLLSFIVYCLGMISYFLIYIPIRKYLVSRKEIKLGKQVIEELEKNFPLNNSSRDDREIILEKRERFLINSKISLFTLNKLMEIKGGKTNEKESPKVSNKETEKRGATKRRARIFPRTN